MVKKPLPITGVVVDIGNSDFKYAEVDPQGIRSIHRTKSVPNLVELKAPTVGLCVVPKRRQKLERILPVRWITHEDIPIESPKNVGLDRLMALYAASQLYNTSTVVVIDVGTFLTISVMRNLVFEGGYIVPGPHTMMAAYSAGAMLPEPLTWRGTSSKRVLPQDTQTAMQDGTTLTLQGGLEAILGDIRKQHSDILVVGTGGGASLLKPLESVAIINPTLVLEGVVLLAKVKKFF